MEQQNFSTSRKLLLLVGDIGIILFSYWVSMSLLLQQSVLISNMRVYSDMLSVMVVVGILLLIVNGLYSIEWKGFAEIILSVLVSMVCLAVIMMAFSFFIREFSYSRSQLLVSVIIQTVLLIFWRRLMWSFERKIQGTEKILFIGNKKECAHVCKKLLEQPQLSLKIHSICTDFENQEWEEAAEYVRYILICPHVALANKSRIIRYCYEHHKTPLLVPELYEVFCSGLQLRKIDDIPVFEPQGLSLSAEQRIMKRVFDIAVSGIVFLIALPFMVLAAAAVKIDDHGPVFYKQDRVGQYGKVFAIYKFRTMRVGAEQCAGPQLASEHDPRITRAGRFLRATRLDELPQLWNVLIGDMSLVGPRPERPYFVEQYEKQISYYSYRTNVKPGITGLAQVYGKYNTKVYDKLIYDLLYIQKSSILEDLVLMIQTVRILFTGSAAEGVKKGRHQADLKKYGI